eukprot:CAMPEP_0117005466 /NCGR_PEP_ID=MMETSP0472-20121206/6073_1 /TAXON_ID=693140 ORGANISM="Tiarina fusus, Strain LIS" /NCGR_SAMPLE_ID=MMETSP0472 /ASSEMBLY_ACC=CAM_ASM_000603 /LENGTH=1224 /DNA_ID=CAMNT_0004706717 /DNA_START=147 /DNA_END=3821 /DNA_ORIENTATION=-
MTNETTRLGQKKVVETCPSFRRGHLPNDKDVIRLRALSMPHVDSFNYFLEVGLSKGVKDIESAELDLVNQQQLRDGDVDWNDVSTMQFWVEDVKVLKPAKSGAGKSNKLLPRETRERKIMYSGQMQGKFCYRIVQRRNGVKIPGPITKLAKSFGNLPIMVMSKACHLEGLMPEELISLKEEDNEFGGYFLVNGNERCIRMLQVPRRNHPTAIQRSNYKNRGPTYTDLGIAIRCARHNGDESCVTNTVHYLTTGGATLKFVARKQEFLIPLILIARALSGPHAEKKVDDKGGGGSIGITDEEFYRRIVEGNEDNTFLRARAELLLQEARARFPNLNTPDEALAYIGSRFRRVAQRADSTSDIAIGHYMIRRYVLIHVPNYRDKMECLLFLLRKLYSFAAGDCGVDNADSLQNHELLMPGHLISTFVKEKFDEMLQAVRLGMVTEMRKDYARFASKVQDNTFWGKLVDRYSGNSAGGIGKKVAAFLSTGTIISSTGLDLMQVSGYTIVAERLNFLRYCSHFRSVHRGQFFMEMKTTAVRKLLPDQWGFLCPVHTPDGGPCGLLSHLSLKCSAMTYPAKKVGKGMLDLDDLLISLGVEAVGIAGSTAEGNGFVKHTHFPVCVDGRVVGYATLATSKSVAAHLRKLKVADPPPIPHSLEVAYLPQGSAGSPYPGLYLFTGAARMVRPVLQRATGKTEYIGPMEQAFMDIACLDEDIREGITTHQELDPTNMLSLIANLTPFSDQNQSPRNMYQCQMGKQTMGTPAHSLPHRTDNKLYKLQNPQAPVVQTATHGEYKMDEYPNGANAVVAVLSYTGFDMEDAMILNQGSYNRGFGHASVYKTIEVDLEEEAKVMTPTGSVVKPVMKFGNKQKRDGTFFHENLENDGLPKVGSYVEKGDPLYAVINEIEEKEKSGKHKDYERAYVQSVRMVGSEGGGKGETRASITLRFNRNPIIGDKFSSRHGQKGVLSILWPQEDMPFSESGISPDVIINPHAFPSRMTIGMLVESMAGKAGALHGIYQDATPFQFHESGDKISVDYFGEQLRAAGYNYYGSEPLYSGVSGCLMHADLYIGVVYYQRLRHMVSDKYQVRATGPVNPLTRQPIKGRKKGGGIRLGEMERDSLLSHGAAFLLQDRLLNCSDRHIAYACSRCGDMLMATTERSLTLSAGQTATEAMNKAKLRLFCRSPACREKTGDEENDEAIEPIVLPYVYRYLVNELAAMNVKLKLDIR